MGVIMMIIITHVATVWKTSDMVDFDQSIFPGLTRYTRCCLSIPPENIRKPLGFLMFSRGIDKQHRAVTFSRITFFKSNFFKNRWKAVDKIVKNKIYFRTFQHWKDGCQNYTEKSQDRYVFILCLCILD